MEIEFRKRTFVLDSLRAVPAGVVETVGTTFSILLAVRVFQAEWQWKALLVALPSCGLLLSLFFVQYVRRRGITLNWASAAIWFFSACGFATAAACGDSFTLFMAGMTPALIGVTLGVPLLSQIYRKHYPGHSRGRLFALTGLVRKSLAIAAALYFGWLLDQSLSNFPWLLGSYAVCCLLMSATVLAMDPVRLRQSNKVKLFEAFRHVTEDRPFRRLLLSWMILGMGNLLCFSLFVDYITNPDYGFNLSEKEISLITTVIPEALFLMFIVQWGGWFDRLNFYKVRVVINLIFATGILIYFLGPNIWTLGIGIAFHGVARAGGNVAWSLWVTKFAAEENVAEYMSIHTFMTGIRGVLAPFLAFPAAIWLGPQAVAIIGSSLIIGATILIAPSLKETTPMSS